MAEGLPWLSPIRNSSELRGLCRRSYFGPRTCGRRIARPQNSEASIKQVFDNVTVVLDFGLWRSYSAVTVSPSGPRKLFKGVTTATSGVLARFPLLLHVRNSFASYGASAVTRTSDRGHVAEAKNQGHRSGGVPIRVSKEILLPLNVHWCSVSSTKMLKTVH